PQSLSSGRNIFERLGPGFALLSFDGEETVCGAFGAAAEHLKVPLEVIRDRRTRGTERYEAKYVLVRPDHFVAWAGNEVSPEAATILRRAVGVEVDSTA
ncbi:MAG: monooxygenase, partial [Hyphomicrobiaceae bacterium]|nr:monooxygenase [Hyphomicrobiaceae bacterium]